MDPVSTKADTRIQPRTILVGLALLCGLLYFSGLGSVAFYEEDEPRFSAAARGMLETGDYLTPRFNGKLRINKPILFYWLAAPSMALFGPGELGARFPSAVLGTALVLVLFLFARHYSPPRSGMPGADSPPASGGAGGGSVRFAAISALALATCLQLAAVLARAATADMGLIFFLTTALLAFYRAYTVPGMRWPVLLFWVALGFAALAKGPVAVVLAGGTIGLFLLLRGDLAAGIRRMFTPLGLLLFALVAVPWYAAELVVLGKTFWDGFFIAEHFGRYQGQVDPHRGPIWYYAAVLPLLFYPWSAFLPAGLSGVLRERRGESSLRLFALCWMIVVFALFTFSKTKLPHYIAPLYPAAALLVGWAWEQRLRGEEGRAWRAAPAIIGVIGLLFTALFAGVAVKGPEFLTKLSEGAPASVGAGPALLALLFGAGWIGGILLVALRRHSAALAVMGGTLAAALLSIHLLLAPVVARYWQDPLRDLARDAAARAGEQGQFALWDLSASGVVYYSRQVWERVYGEHPERLAEMAAQGPLYVITTAKGAESVPAALGLQELGRRPGLNEKKGPYVLMGPLLGGAP